MSGVLPRALASAIPVASLAAQWLVAALWQGVALTGGVALLLRVLPATSAATRTRLWAATAGLIFVLPGLPLLLAHNHASSSLPAEVHVSPAWSLGVLVFWLALSLRQAVQLGTNAWRVWGILQRAKPFATNGMGSLPVRVSAEVSRPCLAGLVNPCVLLPSGLVETLTPAELEHVLLHESEHQRRGDAWLNLFQQASLLLLPMHPAVHWLDRRLCRERELACDEGVLRATAERRAYAACLVKLAEDSMLRKGLQLALGLLGAGGQRGKKGQSELVARVQRILAEPAGLSNAGRRTALAGVGCVMLVATGVFARAPQLVSFDVQALPAAQGLSAMAAVPSVASDVRPGLEDGRRSGRMSGAPVPASYAVDRPQAVRPVLTLASIQQPATGYAPVPAMRKTGGHRRPRLLRSRSAPEPFASPWTSQRIRLNLPGPQVETPHMVRVLMPEAGDGTAQPLYAAVPFRNGWLIVQL